MNLVSQFFSGWFSPKTGKVHSLNSGKGEMYLYAEYNAFMAHVNASKI